MNVFIEHLFNNIRYLFNEVILIISVFFGFVLSHIGYPKEAILFIFTLCIIDIISKWYSIVVINYKCFTFLNFISAWKDKNLSSRAIKNGIGVKVFIYTPILFIAHKTTLIPELYYRELISNTLYSMLILIESISILENLVDSGFDRIKPILDFFKKKQSQLIDNAPEVAKDAPSIILDQHGTAKGDNNDDLRGTI